MKLKKPLNQPRSQIQLPFLPPLSLEELPNHSQNEAVRLLSELLLAVAKENDLKTQLTLNAHED